jgi:hypothetical protein
MSEQECPLEKRIEHIKYNIIGQIFNAGAEHSEEFYRYLDDDGNVSEQSQTILDERAAAILEFSKQIVDLVWDENLDQYVCNDCAAKLEDAEIIKTVEDDLKKKKE